MRYLTVAALVAKEIVFLLFICGSIQVIEEQPLTTLAYERVMKNSLHRYQIQSLTQVLEGAGFFLNNFMIWGKEQN